MDRLEIVIDGNNFSNMDEFYDEVKAVFTKDYDDYVGRNLNAFNDLLRGGFGVFEYGTPISIKWLNADKSKEDLGYEATALQYEKALAKCPDENKSFIQEKIDMAKAGKGQTLFDIIVEIILDTDDSGHDCELILEEFEEEE